MRIFFILIILLSSYFSYGQSVPEVNLIFGTVDMTKVVETNQVIFKNNFTPKDDIVLLIQDYNKLYDKITIKVYYSRVIKGHYNLVDIFEVKLKESSKVIGFNYISLGVYRVEMWNNKKLKKVIAFIIN
jgi:uncharacterized protein with GYD domain